MSKKLKWSYQLNKSAYNGEVTQTLSGVDVDGNTVEMPTLTNTDREVDLNLAKDTMVTLKASAKGSAEIDKTIQVFVPKDDSDYSYAPDNRAGVKMEIECEGDFENIPQNTVINLLPKIKMFFNWADVSYKTESARAFVTDTNSFFCTYQCYYKIASETNSGNWIEQIVDSPITMIAAENLTVTFKVVFKVYNYDSDYPVWNGSEYQAGVKGTDYNEYTATYSLPVTVTDEVTDSFVIDMDSAMQIDIPANRTVVVPYTAKYNDEQVTPTVVVKDKNGNDLTTLFNDTTNKGGYYEHGGRVIYSSSNITVAYPTNWMDFFDYVTPDTNTLYITFTYNDVSITKQILLSVKKLEVSLVDCDYRNIAVGTMPVFKWKVTYDGEEVTKALPTFAILYNGNSVVSGYLTDQFEKSMFLYDLWKQYYNTNNYSTSDWCLSNLYWKAVTTAKREFDTSLYSKYCSALKQWNLENAAQDFNFDVIVRYKGQTVSTRQGAVVGTSSVVAEQTNIYKGQRKVVTYSNVADTLSFYWDDCLSEAFNEATAQATGGAGTFDLNYHWMYKEELNPALTKVYVTVTDPNGEKTVYSSDTADGSIHLLSLDSTNFQFSATVVGEYNVEITLTLTDTDSRVVTVTTTKTCTALEDDDKTFKLTLDTDNAENLETNQVPLYTLHCWYGDEEVTNWSANNKIRNVNYYTDTAGDYIDAETAYYPNVVKGETVTFAADYQGKYATVEHTPTWK